MSDLIKCFQCGKTVSASAKKCPHCNSEPHAVTCPLCRKPVSKRLQVHPECLEEHRRGHSDVREYSCPVCQHTAPYRGGGSFTTTIISSDSTESSCSNCGHPLTFHCCGFCLQPVLKQTAKIDYQGYMYDKAGGHRGGSSVYHQSCYSVLSSPGCFIATAVYESALCNEVILLKNFRDNILLKSLIGRFFVTIYYMVSPPIALLLCKHFQLKEFIRKIVLNPIVKWIQVLMEVK